MAKPVISYDKDLPEIPGRQAHLPPAAHLRRKSRTEFEIVEGRRPSKLLLVNGLRQAVAEWRDAGYPDASEVSERLLTYWFGEDHLVDGQVFRYYFGQREAIETLIYLTEIRGLHATKNGSTEQLLSLARKMIDRHIDEHGNAPVRKDARTDEERAELYHEVFGGF